MKRFTIVKRDLTNGAVIALIVFLVLLAIFLVARFSSRTQTSVQIGTETYQATVSDSEEEREHGLSGTTSLASGTGMLFIFPHDDEWSIWMKDMRYPIDVIWMNADKKVIATEKGIQPDSYPKSYAPRDAARYVLELPAGSVDRAGITVDKTGVWSDNT